MSRRRVNAALIVAGAAAVVLATNASAAIINVGPGDSIQAAIDAAVDGDEIVVAPGTYFETINFLGKAIWLHSSDGPEVTIIDATGFGVSVARCTTKEGADTVLDGFTLTGGTGTNSQGGGMYNHHSSSTVINCTFTGNEAFRGGGMYNGGGSSPTVTNCAFSGNEARLGGGMYNGGGSPTVTSCTFSGNTATGAGGGGMYNVISSPTVTSCTFSGNTADLWGGGMYNDGSSPTVTNCTFEGNAADSKGGGMYNEFSSSPTVTNCAFRANEAFSGGGMYGQGSSPTLINCSFSGNEAYFGGAMMTILGSATVTNCILWNNVPDQIDEFDGVATVTYSDVQGGWPGTGNISADPLFVDPDNGDFRLSSGSPCIDAGDNTALPLEITTDLDSNLRLVDDPDTPDTGLGKPPIVDIGAYELQVDDDDDSDDESDDSSSSDSSSDDSVSDDSSSSDSSDDSDDESSD